MNRAQRRKHAHDLRRRPLRIAVYAISKNEEKHVERFCASADEADLILIADTGSDDSTMQKLLFERNLRPYRMQVVQIHIHPWRFDLARNAAMASLPSDIDVCVSLDLDEELQPGWRQEIERVWKVGETTRLRYMFNWGGPVAFKYEKIHARNGYKWHHPCHEYPMPYGIQEVWADTDFLMVIHKSDPTKSRGFYLPLLKMSVEEDPHCPRNAFYYARELSFNSLWQQSIDECRRYLALPRADWNNERCYAYRTMGRCYKELGDHAGAERAFQMACHEAPSTREPWCELAMLYYHQARWPECYAAAKRCLALTFREMLYTVDPIVWGARPHDLAAIAAWNMGLRAEAVEQGRLAAELEPDDDRLQNNLLWFEKTMSGENREAAE